MEKAVRQLFGMERLVVSGARAFCARPMLVREASDIQFRVTDGSGTKVLERQETIRTNFCSQGAGSSGTLAHPIAQKIADRIKEAKLK